MPCLFLPERSLERLTLTESLTRSNFLFFAIPNGKRVSTFPELLQLGPIYALGGGSVYLT
jgi:hypothetical protein